MKFTFLSLCTFCALAASAQDADITLFSTNYSRINPAATGLFERISASAYASNPWPSLSANYHSVGVGYQQQVDKLGGGLGFNYSYNPWFFGKDHKMTVQYSYGFKVNQKGELRLGIGVGAQRFQRDEFVVYETSGEPLIPYYGGTAVRPVLNLGSMYKGKRLSIGLSVSDVNDKDLQVVVHEDPHQVWTTSVNRGIYLTSSYLFDLGAKFQLEPQLLYYAWTGYQTLNLNVIATYNKQFWLGGGCQNRDGFRMMAGVDLHNFRLGYSSRTNFSRLNNGTSGWGHELVLRYAIPYED